MEKWKRLAALGLMAALVLALLSGCGGRAADSTDLNVCVGAAPVTLDPIYAEETGDQTILEHLYENLMRVTVDVSGETTVTNGMAKSVTQEANYDGTVTYTFRLRSAKWSDGRAVRAADFVYAWRRLADPASQSPYAKLLSVVAGYDETRATGDVEQLQVSAKNDSTLVVVLNGSYDWFLTEVCTSPATMPLREDVVQQLKDGAETKNQQAEVAGGTAGSYRWWSDPTALVTNGPYQAVEYDTGDFLKMAAAERYYGTQAGPEQLTFYFAGTAEEAWELYQAQTVDAVWPLPEEQLAKLAEQENWTGTTELGTYAALFNCNVFQDAQVREALALAIDRSAAAEAAGVTAHPAEGLVPPGVPETGGGDFRETGGALLDNDPELYEERCAQAKALLEEAGYDSGANLGELEYLYVDSGFNGAVAQAVCDLWQQVLRLRVTPRGVTEQELWAALRSGDYSIAGVDLTAVGNDAECFLMEWTSDSTDNVTGYVNSAYDTLMSIIASASDGTARMGCLHDAEELLLADVPLTPLYTRNTDWALWETLTGVCRDARGWFSFANVTTRNP